jgi:hypothetical protein
VQESDHYQGDDERRDLDRVLRQRRAAQRILQQVVDGGLGHVQDQQRADRDAELTGG